LNLLASVRAIYVVSLTYEHYEIVSSFNFAME
jgi:hypothetical protein